MSCLNITVTPERAWLSSDSRPSAGVPGAMREGAVTDDPRAAAASPPGPAGTPAPVLGHLCKIVVLPRAPRLRRTLAAVPRVAARAGVRRPGRPRRGGR